jgi:hypothetical protein
MGGIFTLPYPRFQSYAPVHTFKPYSEETMSSAKKLYAVTPLAHPASQPRTSPKREKQQAEKATSILDQNFAYTPAAATDLRARFKAMGFRTPKPKKVR